MPGIESRVKHDLIALGASKRQAKDHWRRIEGEVLRRTGARQAKVEFNSRTRRFLLRHPSDFTEDAHRRGRTWEKLTPDDQSYIRLLDQGKMIIGKFDMAPWGWVWDDTAA